MLTIWMIIKIWRDRKLGLKVFRTDEEKKADVKITEKHRGWLGYGGAKMKDDAKADLKESFLWGYQSKDGISLNFIIG